MTDFKAGDRVRISNNLTMFTHRGREALEGKTGTVTDDQRDAYVDVELDEDKRPLLMLPEELEKIETKTQTEWTIVFETTGGHPEPEVSVSGAADYVLGFMSAVMGIHDPWRVKSVKWS